ncbi:MAG: AMP-binding protein [Clostridia bacterium]|nr:AMP-binding protein [Clostridia bacterium]
MIDKRMKVFEGTRFDNIRDVINNAIEKYPDNNAFIIKDKNKEYKYITYKTLGEEINSLGTAFINKGLKGKRIAVIGKNRYEWMLAHIAVINGTGISVPLDKGLPKNEIEYSLEKSKADAIVFEKEYIDVIKEIKNNGKTNIKEYFCMDENDEFESLQKLIEKGKKLLEDGNKEYLESKIDSKAMGILLFTSGTTSASKAVMLSHYNITTNIYQLTLSEDIRSTDVNMAFLPFHHTFGSTGTILFLSHGATNVFCDGLRYIQKNLVEYKVTAFVCVPLLIESIYKKIIQEIEKTGMDKKVKFGIKLSRFLLKFKIDIRRKLFKEVIEKLGGGIRSVISGASSLDPKVAQGFRNFGIEVYQGYGLTETAPVVLAESPKAIKMGSVGLPMPEMEVKIDNPNEEGIGEIIAKGDNVMMGYYENEEETNNVLKDGWFYTGDLGYKDKDGFFFITGRKKNVIVLKNGKNVYPEELEILIGNLPYVAESMVFGKEKGDDLVVSAKIVYNKEYMKEKYPNKSQKDIEDMVWEDIKNINNTVPTYKHIKNIIVTDEEMIKTTTAKVKRFEEIKKIND